MRLPICLPIFQCIALGTSFSITNTSRRDRCSLAVKGCSSSPSSPTKRHRTRSAKASAATAGSDEAACLRSRSSFACVDWASFPPFITATSVARNLRLLLLCELPSPGTVEHVADCLPLFRREEQNINLRRRVFGRIISGGRLPPGFLVEPGPRHILHAVILGRLRKVLHPLDVVLREFASEFAAELIVGRLPQVTPVGIAGMAGQPSTIRLARRRAWLQGGKNRPLGQADPEPMRIQNPAKHLDHAKREVVAARYFDIPAHAVESAALAQTDGALE